MSDAVAWPEEALGESVSYALLQARVAIEAELDGESNNGWSACTNLTREIRNGPEGEKGRIFEYGLGNAAFRGRQLVTHGGDEGRC
jgi:hypothetical protein